MNKEALITAVIIAAVAGLLIIGGCSKQPQKQPETQSPQQQPSPQTQPEKQPEQAATPPEIQQQPTPAAEAEAPQQQWEDDLYKDNLDGAIDDLSQLEQ